MRLAISPITLDTEEGAVVCTEADVSLAISSSVAISIVPVDSLGQSYQHSTKAIVGDAEDADIATFLTTVDAALTGLLVAKGI